MDDVKLAILTDAKNEYSLQLVNMLKKSIFNGLKFLYDESKKKCQSENRFDEVLVDFQEYLSQIVSWSQDMIEKEYKRIEVESDCDFIKELITAVFMSHTQILQVIQSGPKKQIQIDIPKPEHFIHKCYINSGRHFYMNPILFYDGPEISVIERHRSVPQAEEIIVTSINETIRQLLPVRRILKTYLQDVYEEKSSENINVSQPEVITSEPEPKPEIISVKQTETENINISDTICDPIISNTINDFIEEIPDLSESEIEDIISKQEFIIPENKNEQENENIKNTLISELNQEFNINTEELDIKPVEVLVESKPVEVVVESKPVEVVVESKPVEVVVESKPVEVLVETKPVEVVVESKPVEVVVETKPVEVVVETKPVEVVVESKPVESKPVEVVVESKPVTVEKDTIKNVEVLDEKNTKLKKKDSDNDNLTIQKNVEPSNELKIDLDLDFDEEINLDDVSEISLSTKPQEFKPTIMQKFKFF